MENVENKFIFPRNFKITKSTRVKHSFKKNYVLRFEEISGYELTTGGLTYTPPKPVSQNIY